MAPAALRSRLGILVTGAFVVLAVGVSPLPVEAQAQSTLQILSPVEGQRIDPSQYSDRPFKAYLGVMGDPTLQANKVIVDLIENRRARTERLSAHATDESDREPIGDGWTHAFVVEFDPKARPLGEYTLKVKAGQWPPTSTQFVIGIPQSLVDSTRQRLKAAGFDDFRQEVQYLSSFFDLHRSIASFQGFFVDPADGKTYSNPVKQILGHEWLPESASFSDRVDEARKVLDAMVWRSAPHDFFGGSSGAGSLGREAKER